MKNNLEIGCYVRLTDDVEMFNRIYEKGHIFKIYGDSGFRGWDLIDDDGNKMDECLFIHDKLEVVDIKEIRLKKLNKINSSQ